MKLNHEESSKLNFDYESHKVMQKNLSSSAILEFEENDVLDDLHLEIMDTCCQDSFETECKRTKLKMH